MSDRNPYRTPGREVTDADRAEPVTPPMPPSRPLTEAMIAAHKEANRRSHGRRYELTFILSNAAHSVFEMEHISWVSLDALGRAAAAGPGDPDRVIRSRPGCRYVGSLRGVPMFVDPEMLGGWTPEMEYVR